VTALISTTSGRMSIALVGLSPTNLNLASRESSHPPQLSVTTG